MNYNYSSSESRALQGYIQKVYQWMAAGLAVTGFTAFWAVSNIEVLRFLSGGMFFVLALAELGLVWWLSSSISRISFGAALGGFLVYSMLNGLTLSYLLLIYTGASVALSFFLTAGTFAAVSVFGWATKTDLSSLRGFFMMALIGLIIASLVNIFLHSSALYWIISYAGVAIFIGITAYDTQRLKELHQSGGASDQMAIMGALKLYLDFINMFIFITRIFGRRR
jgi:uncharacterized protein